MDSTMPTTPRENHLMYNRTRVRIEMYIPMETSMLYGMERESVLIYQDTTNIREYL